MEYGKLAGYYNRLEATASRLEMTDILVELIRDIPVELLGRIIFLTLGKLAPDYRGIEFGIAEKMVIKALSFTTGFDEDHVLEVWHREGDPGNAAEELIGRKRQQSLFSTPLTVHRVHSTFMKLASTSGKGTMDTRIKFLAELLHDAQPLDARYIARTVVGKLRLGVADMTVIDALAVHYLEKKKREEVEEQETEEQNDYEAKEGKVVVEQEDIAGELEKGKAGDEDTVAEQGNGVVGEEETVGELDKEIEGQGDIEAEQGNEIVGQEDIEAGKEKMVEGQESGNDDEIQESQTLTSSSESLYTIAEKKEVRDTIEKAYNIHPDIGYIADIMISEGLEGIVKVGMSPGIPVRVMLAERLSTPEAILEKMGGEAAFEFKYDGIRIQAHIGKGDIKLYTRQQEDATAQFPDVVNALSEVRGEHEMIVEGECVPVDINTGEMLPFQMVSRRRGRKFDLDEAVEEFPVVLFLFDVLYLDGESLIMRSFPERRRTLESTILETEKVRLSRMKTFTEPDDVEQFFLEALESGCEGLMAKSISPFSIYRAGARGWLWIKFKRDYRSELADTVDLTVIGGFYGRGRRAGTFGALLMAAYDPENDIFETVCKLGSGFDDAFLEEMNSMFRIRNDPSPRVNSQMKADVWFEPEKVFEVVGAEITLSPIHTCARDIVKEGAGIAVRFPRFLGRIRDDKTPEDSTSRGEMVKLYNLQFVSRTGAEQKNDVKRLKKVAGDEQRHVVEQLKEVAGDEQRDDVERLTEKMESEQRGGVERLNDEALEHEEDVKSGDDP